MIDLRADLHGHAIDYACDVDRRWFRLHPEAARYLRPAIEHEHCLPGWPCTPTRDRWTAVYRLSDDVRLRGLAA
jgi:hypothetical protein